MLNAKQPLTKVLTKRLLTAAQYKDGMDNYKTSYTQNAKLHCYNKYNTTVNCYIIIA